MLMEMLISGIVGRGDTKHACVLFTDGENTAEGTIPDCRITKYNGFTEDEVMQLEAYLKKNLDELKSEAAKVSPIRAMLKEQSE